MFDRRRTHEDSDLDAVMRACRPGVRSRTPIGPARVLAMLGLADWYYLARPDSVGKRAALETAIQVVMPRLSAAEMARVRAERVLPDWFWPAVDDEAAGWRSV